jgi:chromate reductase
LSSLATYRRPNDTAPHGRPAVQDHILPYTGAGYRGRHSELSTISPSEAREAHRIVRYDPVSGNAGMNSSDEPASTQIHVLAIAGSLRAASYNRQLLQNAVRLAPVGMTVRLFDLAAIPLYNSDLDTTELRPEPVAALKQSIEAADGLLLATPEYNHGVPGVLKNAIDWASRPEGMSPLRSKPVAIVGASIGAAGTARAQQQLKLVMLSTRALLLPHSGLTVGNAREKFGAHGALVDEPTSRQLASVMDELSRLIPAFRGLAD